MALWFRRKAYTGRYEVGIGFSFCLRTVLAKSARASTCTPPFLSARRILGTVTRPSTSAVSLLSLAQLGQSNRMGCGERCRTPCCIGTRQRRLRKASWCQVEIHRSTHNTLAAPFADSLTPAPSSGYPEQRPLHLRAIEEALGHGNFPHFPAQLLRPAIVGQEARQ